MPDTIPAGVLSVHQGSLECLRAVRAAGIGSARIQSATIPESCLSSGGHMKVARVSDQRKFCVAGLPCVCARKPAPKKSRSTNPFVAVQMAPSPAVPAAVCRVHLKDVTIECANLPPPAWLAQLAMGAPHAVP